MGSTSVPQAMNYKANSVIYFRGDASKKIYILQSGRIILKKEDIETSQEVQESVQTGEFFGVKSALGKYERDEDAIVVSDSQVVMFTVPEFEAVVSQNSRVGMKMLKVFSNQLRRFQSKVRSLMAIDEQRSPEEGLYHNIEFFLKKKKYEEAIYILRKYIKHYPTGRYINDVKKFLAMAEQYAQKYGSGNGPSIVSEDGGAQSRGNAAPKKSAAAGGVKDPDEKAYYDAVSLEGQGKFQEAMPMFAKIAAEKADSDVGRKSQFEVGRCLFGLKQFDPCIKHFGGMVKQYPEMPELADALFHVGQCYEKLGDKGKAASVYERILQIEDLEDDTRRKVKLALKAAGGK